MIYHELSIYLSINLIKLMKNWSAVASADNVPFDGGGKSEFLTNFYKNRHVLVLATPVEIVMLAIYLQPGSNELTLHPSTCHACHPNLTNATICIK